DDDERGSIARPHGGRFGGGRRGALRSSALGDQRLEGLVVAQRGPPARALSLAAIGSGSGVSSTPPKPCIRLAHCRPTSVPLTTGSNKSDSSSVSGSHNTMCTQVSGAYMRSRTRTPPTTIWPTMEIVK